MFAHEAFERAKDVRADTVVIGACWHCYFDDPLARLGYVNSRADLALNELQEKVQSLVLAGKRVYLVLGIPFGADFDPRSMIHRTIVPPGFRVVTTSGRARAAIVRVMESSNQRLIKIAKATGAVVIDPMQWLCDDRTCPAVSSSGDPVYHDQFDLSPSYVRENVHFLDGIVLDTRSDPTPGDR
jgi:hypothetical protein